MVLSRNSSKRLHAANDYVNLLIVTVNRLSAENYQLQDKLERSRESEGSADAFIQPALDGVDNIGEIVLAILMDEVQATIHELFAESCIEKPDLLLTLTELERKGFVEHFASGRLERSYRLTPEGTERMACARIANNSE